VLEKARDQVLVGTLFEHQARAKDRGVTADTLHGQEIDAAVQRALARGRAAWPRLSVDEAKLVTILVEAARGASDVNAAIGELAVEDLYLAQACAAGAREALQAFETTCGTGWIASLRQMGLAHDVVDELVQQVRMKLFVPTDGPPKIATYSGRASLRSWVRTVATRAAVDRLRIERPAGDNEALERIADVQADPALDQLRAKYQSELKVAFEAALATLDVRERNLLRHHFVDGLTHEQIGALYGVHKSTAFRWVEAARAKLSKRSRVEFQQRVSVMPGEVDSVLRALQSHIDLSIGRILAA
jgi:RNA polymerase sigma-70 factor (ECF subfamily)